MTKNKGILIFNVANFNLRLISAMLEAEDCNVYVTSLPLEAIHILKHNDIDVVLAPPRLDGMDGDEFKELAEKICPGVSVFLLPLNAQPPGDAAESRSECLVDINEFAQFIKNHIRIENRLIAETTSFKEFFFAFTDKLLQLLEADDNYFFNNDSIVAGLSCMVARKMGLDEKLVDAIHLAALLRDIGKIGIRPDIFLERGLLEQEELAAIKSHPQNAVQILKQINFPWNVDTIIIHHHEHYNGNGYPDGLQGRCIPLGSRIIAAADAYVAMTKDRPYRKALAKEVAIKELMRMAGSQFDPEVVEVLIGVLNTDKGQEAVRKRVLFLYTDRALAALVKLNLNIDDVDINFTPCSNEVCDYREVLDFNLVIAEEGACASDFIQLVRKDAATKDLPILIVTQAKGPDPDEADPLTVYLAQPLDIEFLQERIKVLLGETQLLPVDRASVRYDKGVSGSLDEMGITDIVQVLNMGLKTARLCIFGETTKGVIFLKNGKIVNVTTGELKGNNAFFELVGIDKGVFSILHGLTTAEENVTMDTMTLLLEACRVLDEKRGGRESAP
jgi:putative nucleotidyltransferase with HDIG domain